VDLDVANRATYFSVASIAGTAGPLTQELPSFPILDLAFLPTLVIEAAGIVPNARFRALAKLRDRCGGRYADCGVDGLLDKYHAWVFDGLKVMDL